jgi:hypothetical protein
MSTTIEFYKLYSRRSRSPESWNDRARVVMLFDSETKQGIYLHLGEFGINGIAISSQLQKRLPEQLQQQYIEFEYIDVVMHIFLKEMEHYCRKHVKKNEFKKAFFLNPKAFFSAKAKNHWLESYELFLKQT